MAKKSHRIASRQAAVGKERKHRKKVQAVEKRPVSYTAPPDAADATDPAAGPKSEPVSSDVAMPVTATSPQPIRNESREAARYHYVIKDLRTIAIIAGPLIVLLIILALIL